MMNRDAYSLNVGRRLLLVAAAITAVLGPIAAGVLGTPSIRAQQPSSTSEFDAVSVKPSDPNNRNGTMVSFTPGAGLHVINATLKDLIETAYDARELQILGGPSWAGVTKYDVTGTPNPHPEGAVGAKPSQPSNNNVRLKVQAMLKDRFQLQLHRETRIVAVYSLVVARGGIKPGGLRATDSPHRGVNAGRGTILGEAASMVDFTSKLPRLLGRPVVNNTGLEGNYDFKLEWTPDPGPSAPDGQPVETSLGPSIFSALQQQLGLRLEATEGPVDVLVIDHVDKPSEN